MLFRSALVAGHAEARVVRVCDEAHARIGQRVPLQDFQAGIALERVAVASGYLDQQALRAQGINWFDASLARFLTVQRTAAT